MRLLSGILIALVIVFVSMAASRAEFLLLGYKNAFFNVEYPPNIHTCSELVVTANALLTKRPELKKMNGFKCADRIPESDKNANDKIRNFLNTIAIHVIIDHGDPNKVEHFPGLEFPEIKKGATKLVAEWNDGTTVSIVGNGTCRETMIKTTQNIRQEDGDMKSPFQVPRLRCLTETEYAQTSSIGQVQEIKWDGLLGFALNIKDRGK